MTAKTVSRTPSQARRADTRNRRIVRHAGLPAEYTLPLFQPNGPMADGQTASNPLIQEQNSRHEPASLKSVVLEIYWAASLELHRLGAHYRCTSQLNERRALQALIALEEQRRDVTRRLLAEIWDVHLPGAPMNRGTTALAPPAA